jgi:hypothetical protein
MIRIIPIRPITVVVARPANAPENTGLEMFRTCFEYWSFLDLTHHINSYQTRS